VLNAQKLFEVDISKRTSRLKNMSVAFLLFEISAVDLLFLYKVELLLNPLTIPRPPT